MRDQWFYTFIILFSFLLNVSCSKDYKFKRDSVKISNEIYDINESDQNVRHKGTEILVKYKIRSFETVMDSIEKLQLTSIPDNVNFDFIPLSVQVKNLELNQKIKFQQEYENYKKIMKETDSINLDKMKNLIKKYGFPDINRPWANDSLKYGISFVISHNNVYSDRGKSFFRLLIKEREEKRISDPVFQHILWDANGRKGEVDTIVIDTMLEKIKIDLKL